MIFRLRAFYAVVLLASTNAVALAAPATPEGAAKITTALQPYVGAKADVVTVTPAGEAYDIKVDVVKILPHDKLKDVAVEISPLVYKAVDQGGGKWLLTMDQPISFVVKTKDVEVKGSVGRMQSSCQFDEAIQACASSAGDLTDLNWHQESSSQGIKLVVTDYSLKSLHTEGTAKANSAGGIDGDFVYTGTELLNKIVSKAPNMPFDTTLTVKNISTKSKINQYQTQAVMKLWTWFVANSAGLERVENIQTAVVAKQDEVKTILREVLPLFQNITSGTVYDMVELITPMGVFTIDKVQGDIDLNGIVADGKISEVITIDGLKAPARAIPEFATGLIPSKLRLDVNFKDFNLDAPARLLLDVDFAKGPPPGPEFTKKLQEAILPTGSFTFFSKDTNVIAEAFNLTTDNNLVITPNAPNPAKLDSLTKVTGLEKVMDIIKQAPAELNPQQAMVVLTMVKGMGKQESDGSISWKVETTPDNKILVNGVDVKKMMGAQ